MSFRTKLVSIRSRDRISGTISDFRARVNKVSNVLDYKIQNILIPLSFYNVNITNNTISFNDGIPRLATIAPGFYNILDISTALVAAMNAISTLVFSIVINSVTQKITISSTVNFSIDFTAVTSDLPILIGFNRSVYTGASTFTSDNVVNLNRIYSVIDISSNNLSKFNQQMVESSNSSNSIITRISNSIYKPTEYLYYSNDDNSENKLSSSSITSLDYVDFKITDVDGNLIDFNNIDEIVINMIVRYLP